MADSSTSIGHDGPPPVVSSNDGLGHSWRDAQTKDSVRDGSSQEIHVLIYKDEGDTKNLSIQSSSVRMQSVTAAKPGIGNSTLMEEKEKSSHQCRQGKTTIRLEQGKARGALRRVTGSVGSVLQRVDTARLNMVKENVAISHNGRGNVLQVVPLKDQKSLSDVSTVPLPALMGREPLILHQATEKQNCPETLSRVEKLPCIKNVHNSILVHAEQHGFTNSMNSSGVSSPSYFPCLATTFSSPMAASTPISKPRLANMLSSAGCHLANGPESLEVSEQIQTGPTSLQQDCSLSSPSLPLSNAQQVSSWSMNSSKSVLGSLASPVLGSPLFSSPVSLSSPLSFPSAGKIPKESRLPPLPGVPGGQQARPVPQHAPENYQPKAGTSLEQTQDSGLGLSAMSSAQTLLVDGLESEFGATCSSWATSDDSSHMLADPPVGGHESQDENSNSQGEDSEMNRSLTGIVWLKDYALKKPTASVSNSKTQSPEELVSRRLESRHNRNLCVCNPGAVDSEHDKKPVYKYKTLIEMALQSRPDYTMMSCEIREWLMHNFEFFKRHENCAFWKNAVRHNLTRNDCFVKNKIKKRHWTLDLSLCCRADARDSGFGSTGGLMGETLGQKAFPEPVVLKSLGQPMVLTPGLPATACVPPVGQLATSAGKLAYQPILPRPAIPSQIALLNVNQLPPSFLCQQPSLVLHIPSPGPPEIPATSLAPVAIPTVAPKLPLMPLEKTSRKKASTCTSSKGKGEGKRTASKMKRTKSTGSNSGKNVLLQAAIESGLTSSTEQMQHAEDSLFSETNSVSASRDSNPSISVKDEKQDGHDGQKSLMKRSLSTPAILAKRGKWTSSVTQFSQSPEEGCQSHKPKGQSRTRRKQRFAPIKSKPAGIVQAEMGSESSEVASVSQDDICTLFSPTDPCVGLSDDLPTSAVRNQASSGSDQPISEGTGLLSSPEHSNPMLVQSVMRSPQPDHSLLLDSSTPLGKLKISKESLPSPISKEPPCLADPSATDSSLMLDDISAILTQTAPQHTSPSAMESPRATSPHQVEKTGEDLPGLSTPPSACVKTPHCWSMKSFEDTSPALDLGISSLGNLWDFSDDDLLLLGHSPVSSKNGGIQSAGSSTGQSGVPHSRGARAGEASNIHTKFYNRLQQAADIKDSSVQNGDQEEPLPAGDGRGASQHRNAVQRVRSAQQFSGTHNSQTNQQYDGGMDSSMGDTSEVLSTGHSNKNLFLCDHRHISPDQQPCMGQTSHRDQSHITGQDFTPLVGSTVQEIHLNPLVNQTHPSSSLYDCNLEPTPHDPADFLGQEALPEGRQSCPGPHHSQEAVPRGRRSCPVGYGSQDSISQVLSSCPADHHSQDAIPHGRRSCPADYHGQESVPHGRRSCPVDYQSSQALSLGRWSSPEDFFALNSHSLSQNTLRPCPGEKFQQEVHATAGGSQSCSADYPAPNSCSLTQTRCSCPDNSNLITNMKDMQNPKAAGHLTPMSGLSRRLFPLSRGSEMDPPYSVQQSVSAQENMCAASPGRSVHGTFVSCWQSCPSSSLPSPQFAVAARHTSRSQPSAFSHRQTPSQASCLGHRSHWDQLPQHLPVPPQSFSATAAQPSYLVTTEHQSHLPNAPFSSKQAPTHLCSRQHELSRSLEHSQSQQPQLAFHCAKAQTEDKLVSIHTAASQNQVCHSHPSHHSSIHHVPVQTTSGLQHSMLHSSKVSDMKHGWATMGLPHHRLSIQSSPSSSCPVRQKPPMSLSLGFSVDQQPGIRTPARFPGNRSLPFPLSLERANRQQSDVVASQNQRLHFPRSSWHEPSHDFPSSAQASVPPKSSPSIRAFPSSASFHGMVPASSDTLRAQTYLTTGLSKAVGTSSNGHSALPLDSTPENSMSSSRLNHTVVSSFPGMDQLNRLPSTVPSHVANGKVSVNDSVVFGQDDYVDSKRPSMPNFLDMSLDQPSLSDQFYVDFTVSPAKLSAGTDVPLADRLPGQGRSSHSTPYLDHFGTSNGHNSNRATVSQQHEVFEFPSPQPGSMSSPSQATDLHQQLSVLHFDAQQHGWASQTDSNSMSSFYDSLFESSPSKLPSQS